MNKIEFYETLKRLEKTISKNRVIVMITIVSALILSISTIAGFTNDVAVYVNNHWSNSIGYNKAQYRLISDLKVQADLDYFYEKLGKPISTSIDKRTGNKQHIYAKRGFFYLIVTNEDNKIILTSLTTRKKNFNPTFFMPAWESEDRNKIILGKSKFSDLSIVDKPTYWGAVAAGHGFLYMENYYAGHIGYYYTYVVSTNNFGFPSYKNNLEKVLGKVVLNLESTSSLGSQISENHEIERLRKKLIINTFTIIKRSDTPSMKFDEITEEIGFSPVLTFDDIRPFQNILE